MKITLPIFAAIAWCVAGADTLAAAEPMLPGYLTDPSANWKELAEAKDYCRFMMRRYRNDEPSSWGIIDKATNRLVGTIGYNLNSGILRGLGNSRTTLLFLAISTVLNIALDLLFVLVFRWGVFGAALATIIAQASSWLFGLVYINRAYPNYAIRPLCFRFDRELFREIMRIGLPSGLHMSLVALGSMVVMSKINSYGHDFTAAYNVGSKLDSMAFQVADISKTSGCALARIMRKECAKRGLKGVKVVYSKELPIEQDVTVEIEAQRGGSSRRSTPGSVAFVPAVAGIIMAGEVIKDLIK